MLNAFLWFVYDAKENYLATVMTPRTMARREETTEILTTVHRECCAISHFPVARCVIASPQDYFDNLHLLRRQLTSKEYVFFSQTAHLYILTCCAARPHPDSNRRDGHRVLKVRAAEGYPSTRWLDSQNSHPPGSGRILLASIHGRVLCEIRPKKSQDGFY